MIAYRLEGYVQDDPIYFYSDVNLKNSCISTGNAYNTCSKQMSTETKIVYFMKHSTSMHT